MDTDSFMVYMKTEGIESDIKRDIETRFHTFSSILTFTRDKHYENPISD